MYGLKKDIPNVDFNKNVVFFIGLYESGSCPYEINKVEMNIDNNLSVFLLNKAEVCTSDSSSKTYVLQIEKELFEKLNDLIIVRGVTETKVPFE